MRRPMFLAALLLLACSSAARASEIPIDQVSLPIPRDKSVHLAFPVGELRVEASTSPRVTLDLTARCKGWGSDRCEEYAKRIRIEADDASGALDLQVKGYPKMQSGGLHLRGVLRVPASLAVKVDMGVGELRIADVEGDLDVDLGVGDAVIHTPNRAVRSVDVATGVGDADVFASGNRIRRHGFISSTASWDEGRGRSSVNLHVGVGDATVKVE